jgi:P27 family predicted phage terminase small subunit
MRGRPPTPTDLKILRGNPGHRKLDAADEPQPTAGIPEPPAHLSKEARGHWFRMAPELAKMRVLTMADREGLAILCDAWARYVMAEKAVEKHGLLIKSPSGYPIQNPALAIRNQAAKEMRGWLNEFGLTPAARTRVKTTSPNQPSLPGLESAGTEPPSSSDPLDLVRRLAGA